MVDIRINFKPESGVKLPHFAPYFYYRNEFAYSSSDKMVYLRKFSTEGKEMVLLNTLQGHYAEVTCIKWSNIKHKWITGSEDGTIRIWVICYFFCFAFNSFY